VDAIIAPNIIINTEKITPLFGRVPKSIHCPIKVIKIDTLLRAENMATLRAPEADIPKKTLETLRTQTFQSVFFGHFILTDRNNKMTMVNTDWQNIINATESNANIVNTILLNMTMKKEENIYDNIEGQCILC